jgi:ABC-type dipeptide/oligopeptide/nickel transport system permease component
MTSPPQWRQQMKYIIKKIIALIITLLVISLLTFVAFSLIPGDAALGKLSLDATPEAIEALRHQMGLDQPVLVRYVKWLLAALQGDFGMSLKYSNMTVMGLIQSRLPVTIILAVMSLIIIVVVSMPLGLISAKYSKKLPDTVINQVTQVTMAIPSFFLGIILTYVFGLVLQLFTVGGYTAPDKDLGACLSYLIFPAIAVALPKIAMVVKYLRNSMVSELGKDYVRTAYSKGAGKNWVLMRHVLRNALIPVITFVAMVVAEILAGSLVIEQVFSIPGMGRLLVTSITSRDYPVVQASVLYITAIVVIINFIVDILYQVADPRIRTE